MRPSGQGRVEEKISGVKEFDELIGQNGERIVFSGYVKSHKLWQESFIGESDSGAGTNIFENGRMRSYPSEFMMLPRSKEIVSFLDSF